MHNVTIERPNFSWNYSFHFISTNRRSMAAPSTDAFHSKARLVIFGRNFHVCDQTTHPRFWRHEFSFDCCDGHTVSDFSTPE